MSNLRTLAENATPGPWVTGLPTNVVRRGWGVVLASTPYGDPKSEADAAYIAAVSPEVVIALLDRAEAAEARLEELDDRPDS